MDEIPLQAEEIGLPPYQGCTEATAERRTRGLLWASLGFADPEQQMLKQLCW